MTRTPGRSRRTPRPVVVPTPGARAAIAGRRPPRGAVTGAPAPPAPAGDPPPPDSPPPGPGPDQELVDRLAERTADLLRVKAEYDNYRKRVHRDRLAVGEIAVVNVLRRLLPVLDALDSARAQGELTGGLAAVAEVLETELAALGLRTFGQPGDRFDPALHTAVERVGEAGGTPVCVRVLRPGHRVGDHLLRPADVVVGPA